MFTINDTKHYVMPLVMAASILSSGALLARDSEVISLQNDNPSSDDIIGAFMNSGPSAEPAVKYRGISFSKKPKPNMAEPKSMAAPEPAPAPAPVAQAAPAPQPVAAVASTNYDTCPAKNAIAVNINFKSNSSELDNSNMRLLTEISKAMNSQQLSACKFVVEGHTDGQGDAGYNMRLSRNRAMEVKNFLANADVRYSRMKVEGKGESELMIKDNPRDSRNRRVQFRISN